MPGYGNLCRCACGTNTAERYSVFIPADLGCEGCVPEICKTHFKVECAESSEVVARCINRTAWIHKFAITTLLVVAILLLILGLIVRIFPNLGKYLKIKHPRDSRKTNYGPVPAA